jgi:hypothetical protein
VSFDPTYKYHLGCNIYSGDPLPPGVGAVKAVDSYASLTDSEATTEGGWMDPAGWLHAVCHGCGDAGVHPLSWPCIIAGGNVLVSVFALLVPQTYKLHGTYG